MKSELRLFRFSPTQEDELIIKDGPFKDKSLVDLESDGWKMVHTQYVDRIDTFYVVMQRPKRA